MYESKDSISWDNIESLICKLCAQIRASEYTSIYGIRRGGLIPAVLLSHKLNLPLIDFVSDNRVLIVDDIADSGRTLLQYKDSNDIAVLFCRNTSSFVPRYIGKTITHSDWLIFPWETK